MKGDIGPNSITDKYLDMYKEQLDKEQGRVTSKSVQAKYTRDKSARNDPMNRVLATYKFPDNPKTLHRHDT